MKKVCIQHIIGAAISNIFNIRLVVDYSLERAQQRSVCKVGNNLEWAAK